MNNTDLFVPPVKSATLIFAWCPGCQEPHRMDTCPEDDAPGTGCICCNAIWAEIVHSRAD